MAPSEMPYYNSQPRPFCVPLQMPQSLSAFQQDLYGNAAQNNYSTAHAVPQQPAPNPGFRFPFNMPSYSSLTNSALVDALLHPSTSNQDQQQPSSSSLSANFFQPQLPVAQPRHNNPVINAFDQEHSLNDEDCQTSFRRKAITSLEKRSGKQQKRRSIAATGSDDDFVVDNNHVIDDDGDDDSAQPPSKARRSNRPKKTSVRTNIDQYEEDDDDFFPQYKESKPKKATRVQKPKRSRPARLIRKKPIGTHVPKSLDEAGPADRMMWVWKNQGRSWEEIRSEWQKITGMLPGASSLSVRYIKLVENLAQNGAAGDLELLRFRREAEEELMSGLWSRVAEKMLAYSPESEHNPKDLQKRYSMIVRSGYDVEALVKEDDARRNIEEQKKLPAALNDKHTDDGGGHGHLDDIAALYDDQVANETAARIRRKNTAAVNPLNHESQLSHQYPSDTAGSTNIFEPLGLLHNELDGVNDRRHLVDLKYRVADNEVFHHMMSDGTLLSTSPLQAHKSSYHYQPTTIAPVAGTLVNYGTDSE